MRRPADYVLKKDVPFKLPWNVAWAAMSSRFGARRDRRLLLVSSGRYYLTITEPHASGNANQHLWTQAHTIKHKVRRKRLSAKSKRKPAKRSGTKTWRIAAPQKRLAVKWSGKSAT